MNKYKVIYNMHQETRIFKVVARDKQSAYETFRKTYGKVPMVVSITKVEDVKAKNKVEIKIAICSIIIFVSFLLGLVVGFALDNQTPHPVDIERYVVESGDTLWEIAKRSNGWGKYDPRFIVDDIQRLSDCSANIHPGDTVFIPMYGK